MEDLKVSILPINLRKPNLEEEIARFHYDFEMLSDIHDWGVKFSSKKMTQIWILHAGEEVKDQLRKSTWETPDDQFDLAKVKRKLIQNNQEAAPLVSAREKFSACLFEEGESFNSFHERLLGLASKCSYGQALEENISVQIIRAYQGLDEDFERDLNKVGLWNLDKLIELCRTRDARKITPTAVSISSADGSNKMSVEKKSHRKPISTGREKVKDTKKSELPASPVLEKVGKVGRVPVTGTVKVKKGASAPSNKPLPSNEESEVEVVFSTIGTAAKKVGLSNAEKIRSEKAPSSSSTPQDKSVKKPTIGLMQTSVGARGGQPDVESSNLDHPKSTPKDTPNQQKRGGKGKPNGGEMKKKSTSSAGDGSVNMPAARPRKQAEKEKKSEGPGNKASKKACENHPKTSSGGAVLPKISATPVSKVGLSSGVGKVKAIGGAMAEKTTKTAKRSSLPLLSPQPQKPTSMKKSPLVGVFDRKPDKPIRGGKTRATRLSERPVDPPVLAKREVEVAAREKEIAENWKQQQSAWREKMRLEEAARKNAGEKKKEVQGKGKGEPCIVIAGNKQTGQPKVAEKKQTNMTGEDEEKEERERRKKQEEEKKKKKKQEEEKKKQEEEKKHTEKQKQEEEKEKQKSDEEKIKKDEEMRKKKEEQVRKQEEARKKKAEEEAQKEEERRKQTGEERLRGGQKRKILNEIQSEPREELMSPRDGPSPSKLPRANPQKSVPSGLHISIPRIKVKINSQAHRPPNETIHEERDVKPSLASLLPSILDPEAWNRVFKTFEHIQEKELEKDHSNEQLNIADSSARRPITLKLVHSIKLNKKDRGSLQPARIPLSGCFFGPSSRIAVCGQNMFPRWIDLTNNTSGEDPREFKFKMSGTGVTGLRNTSETAESDDRQRIVFLDRCGLYVFDSMTTTWIKRHRGLSNLAGLACVKEDLFVSYDGDKNRLVFIDAKEALVVDEKDLHLPQWQNEDPSDGVQNPGSPLRIRGLAIHKSDDGMVRIALVDRDEDRILVVDDSGHHILTIEDFRSTFLLRNLCRRDALNHPSGAAFLPDGRLLVSDTDNGRLMLFDELGNLLQPVKIPKFVVKPSFVKVGIGEDGKPVALLGFLGAPWRQVPAGVAVFKIED